MVFSAEDKVIIKHYVQKGYTAYRIWKENPERKWKYTSVKRLIKKFKEEGTMNGTKERIRPVKNRKNK